ncbi:MAG: hypothetical protein ABIT04_12865 [Novosphingobium sp.]
MNESISRAAGALSCAWLVSHDEDIGMGDPQPDTSCAAVHPADHRLVDCLSAA